MSSPVCPVCASPGRPAIAGTVDAGAYFGNEAYRIADGGGPRLDVWRCGRCGHGWSPLPAGIDVLGWYAKAAPDTAYIAEERGRRAAAAAVLKRLTRFRSPPGMLLDVGAGAGFLLSEAEAAGWTCAGLEPAAWAVDAAKKRGLHCVRQGDTSALGAMRGSADAITAIDSIEHLPDPEAFVKACALALKPGGALAVVTPRFDSAVARLWGKRWYCVMPAHLHYFTKRSLTELLARQGLRVVSAGHHFRRFSVGYLLARLLRRKSASPGGATVAVPLFDALEVVAVRD